MHQVSLSSQNMHQRSSIIPVGDIVRSCHLIPVFGRSIDPGWTSDTVSDGTLGQPDRDVARRGHSPSAGVEGKDVTASNSK
jgi:hypothetical protein